MSARRSFRSQNIAQLAESSGLSHSAVSKALGRSALEPLRIEGRVKIFDAPSALRLLLAGDDLDPKLERAMLDRSKRALLDLQIQQKRGELVAADDIDHGYIALASGTSARLQAIPSAIALELSSEDDPAKCREILKREIYAALNDLAEAGREALVRIAAEEKADAKSTSIESRRGFRPPT